MFGLLGLWAGCAATDFAEVPTLQTANLAANPDGDLTATMLGQVVNRYAPLSAAAAAGDTAVSVTNLAALNVAPDDLLLIIDNSPSMDQWQDPLLQALLTACEARGCRQVLAVIGDSRNTGSIALSMAAPRTAMPTSAARCPITRPPG